MAKTPQQLANEQALYDLAERTSRPGYKIDPFLAASALPENQAPKVQVLRGQEALDAIAKDIAEAEAATAAGLNTGQTTGKVGRLHANPSSIASSAVPTLHNSSSLLTSLDSRISEASNATDPLQTIRQFADIKGSIAAEDARFKKSTQELAYAEFQVPDLQRQLQEAIALDDSTPGFRQKYGNIDSEETTAVRRSLAAAKAAADGSIPERLAGNSTYRQLMARSESLTAMAEGIASKNLGKQAQLETAADTYTRGLGPEGLARAAAIFPPEVVKDKVALMGFIEGQPIKVRNDMDQILRASPDDIPMLAFRGSPTARFLLTKQETDNAGGRAKEFLADSYKIADDSKAALAALESLWKGPLAAMPEAERKQWRADLGPALLDAKDEHKARAAAARAFIAKTYIETKTLSHFNSDVLSMASDEALPGFLAAARTDPVQAPGGRISLDQAKVLAMQGNDNAVKSQRLLELTKWYASAANKTSKSQLFKINPLEVEKLRASAIIKNLVTEADIEQLMYYVQ